jgi:hypothetical protein
VVEYDPYGVPEYAQLDSAAENEISARIKEGKDVTIPLADVISKLPAKIQTKGWQRSVPSSSSGHLAVYTNASNYTIRVTTDMTATSGGGKVYGIYYDPANKRLGGGYTEFVVDRSTAKHNNMDTDVAIQRNGIGYIVTYEAAAHLQKQGVRNASISLSNKNSIPILRAIRPDLVTSDVQSKASCCSCCPWCFLTTACVLAKGLADDCHELTVLRDFRDTYLSETDLRRSLVVEYYAIAPGIVAAIDASLDSRSEYESIYQTIRLCVGFIGTRRLSEALATYREMVQCLSFKYARTLLA